jgi:ABC-type transporter Mla maintaining outer membrane lipid asymmetry permease subunit MlaE
MIPLLNFIGLVVGFLGGILLFCDAWERVPV